MKLLVIFLFTIFSCLPYLTEVATLNGGQIRFWSPLGFKGLITLVKKKIGKKLKDELFVKIFFSDTIILILLFTFPFV